MKLPEEKWKRKPLKGTIWAFALKSSDTMREN